MKHHITTALPQIPVVACWDDGHDSNNNDPTYHPTFASSSPVCLWLPTTLTNSCVWCWLVLLGGGKPSFHDVDKFWRACISTTSIGDVYYKDNWREDDCATATTIKCYYYIFYESHHTRKYYDGEKLNNKLSNGCASMIQVDHVIWGPVCDSKDLTINLHTCW